jgi:CRP-like cAMP-binding protein
MSAKTLLDLDQQRYLLTEARLHLATEIQKGSSDGNFRVVKHPPSQSYLHVTAHQLALLGRFNRGETLEQLVPKLIVERQMPPLKEFYELILKSVQKNILSETPFAGNSIKPARWAYTINYGFSLILCFALILFGLMSLLKDGITLPRFSWELLVGFIPLSIAISLGHFLAGCAIKGFGWEVYRPRFKWFSLIPHFSIDASDQVMGGKKCSLAVSLCRMAPMFLCAGLTGFWYPNLDYVMLLGIFLVTDPISFSPAKQLLHALFSEKPLSVHNEFLFIRNRLIWSLLNSKIRFLNRNYLIALGIYTVIWLISVFCINLLIFDINLQELIEFMKGSEAFSYTHLALVISLLTLLALSAFLAMWILLNNCIGALPRYRHQQSPESGLLRSRKINSAQIADFLSQSILLRDASKPVIAELTQHSQLEVFPKNRFIIRQGELGDRLYFIVDGNVAVLREETGGGVTRLADLGPGDIFGEIALIQDIPRTRTIRALNKVQCISVTRQAFQKLLLDQIGARKIEQIIQKQSFLNRLSICRHWHPSALQRLAMIAQIQVFKKGDTVLTKGKENQSFYMIYEGSFQVEIEGAETPVLRQGDFFGEISLLQNDYVTASIISLEESRCLVVHRKEFLDLLSHDFFIGLQFEEIASERIKKPVFASR